MNNGRDIRPLLKCSHRWFGSLTRARATVDKIGGQRFLFESGSLPFFVGKIGVLAQLVERLNGIEEVRGSNPLGSSLRSAKEHRLPKGAPGL